MPTTASEATIDEGTLLAIFGATTLDVALDRMADLAVSGLRDVLARAAPAPIAEDEPRAAAE